MKLWMKYLIAAAAGILLGILLPLNGGDTEVYLQNLYTYVLHIGRYLIFPLVFFGLTIGTYELWLENRFFNVYGRSLAYIVTAALGSGIIGAVFVAVFSPDRVPIIIEEAQVTPLPGLAEQFSRVFPKNLFTVFTGSGDFLLPLIIFAVILGIGLLRNRSVSAPVIDVFESLSRVFYNLNRVILEILSIGLFFMAAYRTSQFRGMADLELFTQLLFVVIAAVIFVLFILIPVLLYFLGSRERNPFLWLFSAFPAGISALISGDIYFTLSSAHGIVGENMGIQQKAGSAMLPLGAVFSRSGTTLVTAISFVLILRSYSSLDITFVQYIWIIGSSILISFMLGTVPGSGMVVSLSLISAWYGQGLEEGFLILLPIAPILTALSVLVDVIVILLINQLVADRESMVRNVTVKDYL